MLTDRGKQLQAFFDELTVHLARWDNRHAGQADAGARRAADDAVASITALTRALHKLRRELVGEARRTGDATAARRSALPHRFRGYDGYDGYDGYGGYDGYEIDDNDVVDDQAEQAM